MTELEYRALYEGVLDRMVKAEWAERHVFSESKGVEIVWTDYGSRMAGLLKMISRTYDLAGGPHHPRMFDLIATGAKPNDPGLSPTVIGFWNNCMADLQLHRDDDDFMSLVHAVLHWGPDLPEEEPAPGEEK
jgi:hypothetical protein